MVETSTWVSIVILIVLVVPTIGFLIGSIAINIAEYTKGDCNFPEGVCRIGTAIGMPTGWLHTEKFLWFAIIPILGVWLTVYGFMSKLAFFGKGVMAGLSFVIAFASIPSGLFVVMVVAMYQLMSFYATIALAILFFVGVFFETRKGLGRMTGEYAAYKAQIKASKENEKKTKERLEVVEESLKKAARSLEKRKKMTITQRSRMGDEMRALTEERDSLKEDLKASEKQRKRFKTLWKKTKK